MKNYLFAPFNDEGEQMEEFYAIRDYLPKKFRRELIMFMARLESTYDVIISKLESDNSSFHGQYDKIQELKAELKDEKYYSKEIKSKLKAEYNKLQADAKHDANVCEEYDEGLREEIKELRAENKRLNDKDGLYDEVKELQVENERLMKQVSSDSGNSSSTHTHTKEREVQAEDWLGTCVTCGRYME